MDPVTVLGAGASVVGLADRARKALATPTWTKRLAEVVSEATRRQNGFRFSRRSLRRWLGTQQAWDLLSRLDPATKLEISGALERHVIRRGWRGSRLQADVARDRADKLEAQLRRYFMMELDPSYALALSHDRMERLLTESPTSAIPLPPVVQEQLEALAELDPTQAAAVRAFLLDHRHSPGRVASLTVSDAELPSWLERATYHSWQIVADFLLAHSFPSEASAAYEKASREGSPHTCKLLVRAALAVLDSDQERFASLIERAESAGPDALCAHLMRAVRSIDRGDYQAVVDASTCALQTAAGQDRVLALSLQVAALAHLERIDEALSPLRNALVDFPHSAGLHDRLSACLAMAADNLPVGHAERNILMAEAAANAIAATSLYRTWSGPSVEAARRACHLSLANGDIEMVIKIGRTPPAGTAVEKDASDPAIREMVALALISLGDLESVRQLEGNSEFVQRYLDASEREDSKERIDALNAALTVADDLDEKALVLLSLAHEGVTDLPQIEELRTNAPEWADFIEASAFAAAHDYDEAVRISSQWFPNSLPHSLLMARSLREAGDTDSALRALDEAGRSLRSPEPAVVAVEWLVEDNELEAAEQRALDGILRHPGNAVATIVLRGYVVKIAAMREDWIELENHGRALLEDHPDNPLGTWAVIMSLAARHRWNDAWNVYLKSDDLAPMDDVTAALLIELHHRFSSPQTAISIAVELARTYPSSEGTLASAAIAVLQSGDSEIPEQLAEQARELVRSYVQSFPDSDRLRSVPYDPDDPAASLKPILEARAAQADVLRAKLLEDELPRGLAMDVLGRPYTLWILSVATGVINSVSPDSTEHKAEVQAAAKAIGQAVVTDISAPAVAVLSGQEWWQKDHFSKVRVPSAQVDDIAAAIDDLRLSPVGSVDWDTQQDRLIVREVSPADTAVMRQRTQLLADLAKSHLLGTDVPPGPEDSGTDRFGPWFDSIRLARRLGQALYADDLPLRRLARSLGIPTFGTFELSIALELGGHVPRGFSARQKTSLMGVPVVDFPFDAEAVLALARETQFSPGPSLAPIARPGAWVEPETTIGLLSTVWVEMDELGVQQHAPYWLAAAAESMSQVAAPGARCRLIGYLLATAVWGCASNRSIVVELVAAADEVAKRVSPEEACRPLREAVDVLTSLIGGQVPDGQVGAAILRLFSGLPPEDRTVVVETLLSVK